MKNIPYLSHIFFIMLCAQSLSRDQLFVNLWIIACHTPLSMRFSRQEYWSGLPCTCWPTCRFLRRQVRWSDIPISLRISHSLLWSTQRLYRSLWSGSRCFSEIPLLSLQSKQMLAIWSLVPLPFLNSACTSESSWFMYPWSLAWRLLSITLLTHEMTTLVQ